MVAAHLETLRVALTPFSPMTPEAFATVVPFVRAATFERGAHTHRAGHVCHDLVFVMDGLVRTYYVNGSREVNLRLLCGGSAALPLSSFLREEPSIEWVQCLLPVTGFVIRLRALCQQLGPERSAPVRQMLAERHYLSMERRLLTLQHKSASERYHYFREHMEPAIVANTPAYHVASYLGVTPESLSRVRNRAQKAPGG